MSQTDGIGHAAPEERSTGELVRQVAERVSMLVRDELKLARLEMPAPSEVAGSVKADIGGSQGKGATVMGSALPEVIPGRQGDEAQQLKEEIERTREQLGEAVGELARVDVKSRVQVQAAELTGRARNAAEKVREQVSATRAKTGTASWVVAAGAVALVVTALVMWQRRKR